MSLDTLTRWVNKILPKKGFLRATAVLAGGTALAQALTLLAAPIISRLYTPDDFGLLVVFSSILYVIAAVASGRYELALPLPKTDEQAIDVLAVCFSLLLSIVCICAVLFWLFGDTLVNLLNASALKPYLWLLPLGVLAMGAYQILNLWAIRQKQFKALATTKFSQSVGQTAVQLLFGWLSASPVGLILGLVVGRSSGSGTLLKLLWTDNRHLLEIISWQGMKQAATRYKRFPLFASTATGLNRLASNLPPLMLVALYSEKAAGYFGFTLRVIALPIGMIGMSMSQVYLGRIGTLIQEDVPAFRRLFFQLVKRLLLLGIIPVLVLMILGPWLFSFVFGAEWYEAGQFAQFMSLIFWMQLAVVPVSQTLNAVERQDLQLYWDIGRLLAAIVSLATPFLWQMSALTAVRSYSIAMFIVYFIYLLLCIWSINQVKPIPQNKTQSGSTA